MMMNKPAVLTDRDTGAGAGTGPLPQGVDLTRRGFLSVVSSAGALGALALLAGQGAVAQAAEPVAQAAAPEPSGYRETEHIRHYYRTAGYW